MVGTRARGSQGQTSFPGPQPRTDESAPHAARHAHRLRGGAGAILVAVPEHDHRSVEGEAFDDLGAADLDLAGAEIRDCRFRRCDLSEGSLRGSRLSECAFEGCELAMVDLADAVLHDVRFEDCRLTGVRFGELRHDPLGISAEFVGCDLRIASFQELDLQHCAIHDCQAVEAEFLACDLRGADMQGSDFARAVFLRNDLRGADLRGARNYVISGCDNRLSDMRVTLPEALGLLSAFNLRWEG